MIDKDIDELYALSMAQLEKEADELVTDCLARLKSVTSALIDARTAQLKLRMINKTKKKEDDFGEVTTATLQKMAFILPDTPKAQ
ncbi:hypothetical protein BCT04_07575 [Vibrio breoganii]|uniref:hypothetical protein n=1 Tax=Vibrio breoganii TaxID=553239 RepID=UPI000C85D0BC|nr:hypothetical protein [Vibrio breoganii]PML92392.1 hypothetical protein BCT64_16395 [Vibrio breoganii]PMM15526.1 hypothetical protein BCT60_06955 [Vibrio breoganii]PMO68284.1 hypothetical protein BCT04_07575 [Vibrio breoganii]PMO74560.1 hypothetical protein BCT02_01425 [Vibrio breoganii]PMO89692.1 hypothetical protein BCS98_16235 [Vibrio breoganii]